jgi:3-oxoacyl-[acyl-carrier protein] reductase
MDLELKDKVVMIAAASRGLGFGIARAVAREGALISIASRNKDEIGQAAKQLREETGASVDPYVCDVTNNDDILGWVANTIAKSGSIYGLVVNSGGPPPGPFASADDDDWKDAFQLTLLSSIRLIRAVLPSMRETGTGAIVTSTSSSVIEPVDNLILSNVMRAGVASLAKTLSRELVADGIRINNLVPGRIDTKRVAQLDANNAARRGLNIDEVTEEQKNSIPAGRYGSIDEFGAAAVFLLSNKASYITGSTMVVDGGKTRAL